jgi:hypothetical protein
VCISGSPLRSQCAESGQPAELLRGPPHRPEPDVTPPWGKDLIADIAGSTLGSAWFMLDRCFGDHVLETMLELGEAVWPR